MSAQSKLYSKRGETLNAYRCSTHDENLLFDMIIRASVNDDMLSLLNIVIDSDFTDLTRCRDDDIMLPISFIANWMYEELFSHDLTERMLETMFNEPAVNPMHILHSLMTLTGIIHLNTRWNI